MPWRWNASRSFASFLDKTKLCQDRTALELGAGGALPSIIAVLSGAAKVVITDYPDSPLIENIRYNVAKNTSSQDKVSIKGYIWGQDTKPLQDFLPLGQIGFDIIILSDLIFNHSQHDALLDTCEQSLSTDPSACVLVFYTHHRPHLAHRDMEFFEKAQNRNWKADKLLTETFPVSNLSYGLCSLSDLISPCFLRTAETSPYAQPCTDGGSQNHDIDHKTNAHTDHIEFVFPFVHFQTCIMLKFSEFPFVKSKHSP